jgi:hypothetical protein
MPPIALARAYLANTPFADRLLKPVPFIVPDARRLQHWHILAETGHGKTQAIQHVVHQDLLRPDGPALIIIEPKGDMIRHIQRLKIFENDFDRIAIIDPKYEPALNIFATAKKRLQSYSKNIREQIESSVLQQYAYIFAALDAEVSKNQSTALAYVVELVISRNGSMKDFLKILNDDATSVEKSEYRDAIAQLDEFAVDFFSTHFYKGMFPASRRALATKIHTLRKVSPSLGRMFFATENHIDLFERINTQGSITLVNTAWDQVSEEASSFLGRFIIAQTLSAARERLSMPEHERKPAFLIIDEAQLYFDESLEKILTQARSMGVGVMFAHHYLNQFKASSLRSAALGMPAIRLASPIDDDSTTVAGAMRTTPDFLKSMRTADHSHGEFGAFVKGMKNAAKVTIPFTTFDHVAKMDDRTKMALLAHNRNRFTQKDIEAKRTPETVKDTANPSETINDRPQPAETSTTPRKKQLPEAD